MDLLCRYNPGMPYLVDGHNLIPKVAGLSLADFDDEQRLIEMLQEFCRIQRKEIEVFFDNAPPGGMTVRNLGRVTARFIRQGITADQAIVRRLNALKRAARNWTVVSSDHAVQREARNHGARILTSEEFNAMLRRTLDESARDPGSQTDADLPPEELDEWLGLFGEPRDEK